MNVLLMSIKLSFYFIVKLILDNKKEKCDYVLNVFKLL
jgi:hypothetical protein